MYADPTGEFAISGPVLIGSLIVAGFATWEAGNQIDRSTDIDPHANMLHAGLIGGGRVVAAAGVGAATFGLGTAAFGTGLLAATATGAAAGGTGMFASDVWGMGWGVQEGFSSPGAYAFAIGTGGAFGAGSSLIGRSLAGRAPPKIAASGKGPSTWNEFQSATKGVFRSRADAAKAWQVYKTSPKDLVIVGETMGRVSSVAERLPGVKILNDMPDFASTGAAPHKVTSAMMQYNRKWILQQMRKGRSIVDIGADPNRAIPSIFYQMERNMIRNYLKIEPTYRSVVYK
jgi:hypothetical protein